MKFNLQKIITITSILVAFLFNSCTKEPPSILSYNMNGKSYNADELFVECVRESDLINDDLICYRYHVGYKSSSDFSFVCIDSTLSNTHFSDKNITVNYKIHTGDSIVNYEFYSGKVDMKILAKKEEFKGTFHFKLVNSKDSTDFITLEDGRFHGRFSQSFNHYHNNDL